MPVTKGEAISNDETKENDGDRCNTPTRAPSREQWRAAPELDELKEEEYNYICLEVFLTMLTVKYFSWLACYSHRLIATFVRFMKWKLLMSPQIVTISTSKSKFTFGVITKLMEDSK